MRYAEYYRWLQAEHLKVILPADATELGPFLTPTTAFPNSPPWQMKWAVIFNDGLFFSTTENWFATRNHRGYGTRNHYSFHYGQAGSERDELGIPKRDTSMRTILRIDKDRIGPHIHFKGEDHIAQARVRGMSIIDFDPFFFGQAVFESRSKDCSLEETMKFSVTD